MEVLLWAVVAAVVLGMVVLQLERVQVVVALVGVLGAAVAGWELQQRGRGLIATCLVAC